MIANIPLATYNSLSSSNGSATPPIPSQTAIVKDPGKLYRAVVIDLNEPDADFTTSDSGESLVKSIPPHEKIKTIVTRFFFKGQTVTAERTRESQYAVFISEHSKENLRQYLAPLTSPLLLFVAIGIAHDIGTALSHLHKHDLIHGNLKPENILLDQNGKLFLTNFKYAKQISMHELADRDDSFSFGILLFLLFTNTPLFQDAGREIEAYRQGAPLPDLDQIEDSSIRRVIAGLLAREPANRMTVKEATENFKSMRNEYHGNI